MNPRPLPESICFRVTRFCNARCSFCLAPPDGSHPSLEMLVQRADWLLAHGVRSIHCCGGEPTIHPGLPKLLRHIHANGGSNKLTTNGIQISDALLESLVSTRTEVKVSLHGDREHHNAMTRCEAFDPATKNIRRLLSAGISTSIQTTVVKGHESMVQWVGDYCLKTGIRRLSILPFIPRGDGSVHRDIFELNHADRARLRDQVRRMRRVLGGQLDVRWLDFTAQPVHVVEPDGRVLLEGATESVDQLICRIP